MKNNPEPYIKLDGYEIKDLSYTKNEKNLEAYKSNFEFIPKVALTKDKKNAKITINAKLKENGENNMNSRAVSVVIEGFFTISDEIKDQEEVLAQTLIVNGTAILFPYIRSMVSMISGLDSAQTIVLPTINTTDLFGK